MQNTRLVRLALFSLFSLSTMLMANGQLLNGKYIGYEKFPFRYSSGILAVIGKPGNKIIKNEFYYEVTLSISDSFIDISKVPVKFINDRLTKKLVDTTAGGYYHYSGKYESSYFRKQAFIHCHLVSCVYCKKSSHGNLLHNYTYYWADQIGYDLMLSSNTQENMLFKRQKNDCMLPFTKQRSSRLSSSTDDSF